MSTGESRELSIDGWGFVGRSFAPPAALASWLEDRLGPAGALPRWRPELFRPTPGRSLPRLAGELSSEPLDRLRHARGRGLADLLWLRAGRPPALPDAVARPANEGDLTELLQRSAETGLRVIPWGGGTSVTGGVNVVRGSRPVVTLDLCRLRGLHRLDEESGLATFGAGTRGPEVEAALAPHRLTLGHYPQSWELSTVGGWVATRASGQESLGYGGIERLLAGFELVAPAGRWSLAPQPATASGPDLRQLVLGSEGRFGVITRATLRVSPQPATTVVEALLLPDWPAGIAACRRLLRHRVPLHLLRLSDEPETEVALAVGLAGRRAAGWLLGRWQRLRRIGPPGCLLLYGAAGSQAGVGRTLAEARALLRRQGGIGLGRGPGRRWLADRFRHPYLRDALLDRGVATETLETAAPWSRLAGVAAAVRSALAEAAAERGERCPVLTHLSHPYLDGCSLYFTFFFRCPADPERAVELWAALKRAATRALLAHGGTLSHHHGVGSWHAPWLEEEIGGAGRELLERVATGLDPGGILNPAVLLDPTDRLEE